jgi:deaminated glutathione amidase
MRIALLQMTSGIDPASNAAVIEQAIDAASAGGASMLFTPEMSGLLDRNRMRAAAHLCREDDDIVLARTRAAAARNSLWVSLGSLAVAGPGSMLSNRSFMIDDLGTVRARYDKMHLFDVDLPTGESWRESAAYAAGKEGVAVQTPLGIIGLSICYDIRFPSLYQALSGVGATLMTVPAAFTVPTGKAHWHTLLRARAIENAAYVIAAAQTGLHEDGRETFGHSLVVDPWGEIILDAGETPSLTFAEIDLGCVDRTRARVPVIAHRQPVSLPRVFP